MPKSKVSKKRMFREFSKLDKKYVHNNYAKNLRSSLLKIQERYDIFEKELKFMLWAYDLEFWTLNYAADEYGLSRSKIGDRLVYPLLKHGLVYKHFDKLTPSQTREDHIFRDETKHNYRVRYALTQKARLLVQAFYRELSR
jgi:uncharacterized protein YktA (UPF0223 family)